MFLDQFPYTNMHEINLDWIIQQVKAIDPKVIAALQQLDPDVIAQVTAEVEKANQYAISAQSASSAAVSAADAAATSDTSAADSANAAAQSANVAATSASEATSVAAKYTSGYYSSQSITFNSDISDNWTNRLIFGIPSFVYLYSNTTALNTIAANSTLFVLPEDSRPVNVQPITIIIGDTTIKNGSIDTNGNVITAWEIAANTNIKIETLICTKYR